MLTILIVVVLILLIMISSMIVDPVAAINLFKITPTKFKLYKPKNDYNYYLKVRILFFWYYIYKTKDNYNLTITYDKFCLTYPNHLLLHKNYDVIYSERYEIIKFFSETSSPKDTINL